MRLSIITLSLALSFAVGCSTSSKSPSEPDKPETKAAASSNCFRYGNNQYFNEQRIQAFLQIITDQMNQVKAAPVTAESTALIAKLEVIRRRLVPPFLEPKLNPNLVAKIILREAKNFNAIFEQDAAAQNPNTQKSLDYLNQSFIPGIHDRDQWGCEQKSEITVPQDNFEPDKPNEPQVMPSEPNVLLEGRPANPPERHTFVDYIWN